MVVERTDRDLVLLARKGDKEAFGRLFERYQPLAARIALRMAGAPDTAQDVVQESMLQAYLSLDDLRDEDRFRSWLYGIVLNVSKSYLREQARRSRFRSDLVEEQPDSGAEDPQAIAIERELHRMVLGAVDELPRAHRETTLLYYYDSLTLDEIAGITGASRGSIKVRLHRARNDLRQKLSLAYPEIAQNGRSGRRRIERILRRTAMIKVNVIDIIKKGEQHVVILQDDDQKKVLPIWVGPAEATAIAMGLRAFPTPRPMTFDFMAHLIEILGAQLEEARVEALKEIVFYGTARFKIGDEVKEIDARPSDVLALAVRTGSPIFVSAEVMHQAGQEVADFESDTGQLKPGEGVDEIIKEIEAKITQAQAQLAQKEEDEAQAGRTR